MSHARLGPSNKRWPHCPGSVREEAVYPNTSSAAAIDGTGSHLLLELCLINGVRADAYDGQIIGVNHEDNLMGWMVHPDRIARVQICLDYVERRVNELKAQFPGCEVLVKPEARSNPGAAVGRDDWWGTCDITITVVLDEEVIFMEVADYKDGRGYVSEKNNGQLIDYLGGQLHAERDDIKKAIPVRMTIVQPKTTTPIRYQNDVSGYVMKMIAERGKAAALTDDPNAPLIPGPHCNEWCKHKGHCSAGAESSMEVLDKMDIKVADFGDLKSLSDEALADLADTEEALMAQFAKVKEEVRFRVEQGINVPGYIMGKGRGSNGWNASAEEIEKALKGRRLRKADIYPASLITPGALKKSDLLTEDQKERIFKQFVSYQPGKPTLKKVERNQAAAVVDFSAEAAAETQAEQPVSFF